MTITKINNAVSPISEVDKINELVDDVNGLLGALYPVGSIYIGTQSTCPLATLISGSTWVLVSSGRVLQGADSTHTAGTTIEAGLPNITGGFRLHGGELSNIINNCSGALYGTGGSDTSYRTPTEIVETVGVGSKGGINIDASLSSSIYGNSATVQPPAYVVNIWQRTA